MESNSIPRCRVPRRPRQWAEYGHKRRHLNAALSAIAARPHCVAAEAQPAGPLAHMSALRRPGQTPGGGRPGSGRRRSPSSWPAGALYRGGATPNLHAASRDFLLFCTLQLRLQHSQAWKTVQLFGGNVTGKPAAVPFWLLLTWPLSGVPGCRKLAMDASSSAKAWLAAMASSLRASAPLSLTDGKDGSQSMWYLGRSGVVASPGVGYAKTCRKF